LIDFSYYFKVGGIKSSWFPYFKRLNEYWSMKEKSSRNLFCEGELQKFPVVLCEKFGDEHRKRRKRGGERREERGG
jgi:hypothetical protein